MKRKWTILLVIVTLFIAVFIFCVNGPRYSIEIIGNLPAADITEIKHLVRRDLRGDILPQISWNYIQRLPVAIKEFMRIGISRIDARDTNAVCVTMTNYPSVFLGYEFIAKRGTNGWSVERVCYLPGSSD